MRRALFYSLCFLKCSTSCGPGVMTRKVECQLTQADGSSTVIPSIACAYRLNKPLSEITCHENITCNNEGEKDITYWLTIYVYRPVHKTAFQAVWSGWRKEIFVRVKMLFTLWILIWKWCVRCPAHKRMKFETPRRWKFKKRKVRGDSVAEWSAGWTRNPAVPVSNPALATCWICSRSCRVQFLGYTAYK